MSDLLALMKKFRRAYTAEGVVINRGISTLRQTQPSIVLRPFCAWFETNG